MSSLATTCFPAIFASTAQRMRWRSIVFQHGRIEVSTEIWSERASGSVSERCPSRSFFNSSFGAIELRHLLAQLLDPLRQPLGHCIDLLGCVRSAVSKASR
jgi:hypothetical protein